MLDAITLKNLHILENSAGSNAGTLINKLNHCSTPFGKRCVYNIVIESILSYNHFKYEILYTESHLNYYHLMLLLQIITPVVM